MKKEVYKYFIKTGEMSYKYVLDWALSSRGYPTAEQAKAVLQEELNHAKDNYEYLLKKRLTKTHKQVLANYKLIYDNYKNAKIIRVKAVVEL